MIEESVSYVDATNRDSHNSLFHSSRLGVSLGDYVPRLRIFFVSYDNDMNDYKRAIAELKIAVSYIMGAIKSKISWR